MPNAASHLKYWCQGEPSAAGLRVAELLDAWHGLHHFDDACMRKADWTNPHWISVKLPTSQSTGQLATFDFGHLTRLVFLAHDHCIRVDLEASSRQYFQLTFHPRQTREGQMASRHPTLEHAVANFRDAHPELAFEAQQLATAK